MIKALHETFRYKTEAEFSRAFSKVLKAHNLFVQRLESGSTGNGIPDMFIQGYGSDLFIENKRVKKDFNPAIINIPWRPGQVAWMLLYYKNHLKRKACFTCICFNNCIIFIPIVKPYLNKFDFTRQPYHKVSSLNEAASYLVSKLVDLRGVD